MNQSNNNSIVQRHYGIIGNPLAQSFSARYFNKKFAEEGISAEYSLYPLEQIEDFPGLISRVKNEMGGFAGMNVTIPYKQAVIPYLNRLDDTAKTIGAINVIRFAQDGTLIGYNSDVIGFMDSIRPLLQPTDRKALVLGTGGAAKACYYGLKQLGLRPFFVSRHPQNCQLSYPEANSRLLEFDVIVNCTPLGMFPEVDAMPPIDYAKLTPRHLLFDCIYNPEETRFLLSGRKQGCRTQNGMPMLFGQAVAAWQIWNKEN